METTFPIVKRLVYNTSPLDCSEINRNLIGDFSPRSILELIWLIRKYRNKKAQMEIEL